MRAYILNRDVWSSSIFKYFFRCPFMLHACVNRAIVLSPTMVFESVRVCVYRSPSPTPHYSATHHHPHPEKRYELSAVFFHVFGRMCAGCWYVLPSLFVCVAVQCCVNSCMLCMLYCGLRSSDEEHNNRIKML